MSTEAPPETRPALWNPNAAAWWSLLFTPVFGAYLHAKNADALGRFDEAKANRLCVYIYLGYLAFVLASPFIPSIPEPVFHVAMIGLLVGWYLTTAKAQVQFVEESRPGYTRKSWTKPLLIATACLVGYFALVLIAAIAADVFLGIE